MTVLYIGGAMRSGSTLLEMILGNIPGFFSVGEVRYFWEYLVRGDIVCGCGVELKECDFWGAVKTKLRSESDIDFQRMAILSRQLNRTRNLPRMRGSTLLGASGEWKELIYGTAVLYKVIDQIIGDQILVDTSKVPSQLFLLRQIENLDLRVLHLVRDGRAVAYSWSKRRKQDLAIRGGQSRMPQRSALMSIIVWIVENMGIVKMNQTLPYSRLRYEDFVENPYLGLKHTLQTLEFSHVELDFLREPSILLNPTHSVGGNPMRFTRSHKISIMTDDEWHNKMSKTEKTILGLMAIPLLLRFNYKL